MSLKTLIIIGLMVGSTVGSMIPGLWGGSSLSLSGLFLSLIGGLAGAWLAYQVSQRF